MRRAGSSRIAELDVDGDVGAVDPDPANQLARDEVLAEVGVDDRGEPGETSPSVMAMGCSGKTVGRRRRAKAAHSTRFPRHGHGSKTPLC